MLPVSSTTNTTSIGPQIGPGHWPSTGALSLQLQSGSDVVVVVDDVVVVELVVLVDVDGRVVVVRTVLVVGNVQVVVVRNVVVVANVHVVVVVVNVVVDATVHVVDVVTNVVDGRNVDDVVDVVVNVVVGGIVHVVDGRNVDVVNVELPGTVVTTTMPSTSIRSGAAHADANGSRNPMQSTARSIIDVLPITRSFGGVPSTTTCEQVLIVR
jgi:hypothetical protein